MNISQLKELEDLKHELATLQKNASSIFKSNVRPLITKFESDFMTKLEEYFINNGFNVSKVGNSISADYRELNFNAILDSNWIFIKRNDAEIAKVRVSYARSSGYSMSIPNDEFMAEKAKISKSIEETQKEIKLFTNPDVFYELAGSSYSDNAEELIAKIFN